MKGSITKKNDKYYPVIYLGKDPLTGKKKYKWGKGKRLKREAEQLLSEMLVVYHEDKENDILNIDLSFNQVAEEWLLVSKRKHAKKTYQMYEGNIKFVNEIFGDVKIKEIKTIHIQRYINTVEGSYSKVSKRYLAIRSVLNYAKKMNLISDSPAEGIELPQRTSTDFNTWTKEEVRYFLDCLNNDNNKWYAPLCIMLTTGMRPGEICGLNKDDFLKDIKSLQVRRSMQNDGTTKDPKNEQSKRKIVITNTLYRVLESQLEWQEQMQNDHEDEYIDSGFICTHELGQPIRPDVFGKAFRKLMKNYNMPVIRLYDCRHTFATLMLKRGVNPKIVSEILGHKSIEETLNTYSHVLPDIQEDAVNSYERFVFGDDGDKVIYISS